MTFAEKIALGIFHQMDPELAHKLSLAALRIGLTPAPGAVTSDRLKVNLAGMDLPNPIGLAAGYDKNAQALQPLSNAGFGFLEVGAATPKPQPGNPKPRLFRLKKDRAVINRFGFNNDGVHVISVRLSMAPTPIPRGLNLGANKDSADRASDYGKVLAMAGPHVDFATVNVSSPNTEKLRDLQGKAALEDLLGQVNAANDTLQTPLPIFLKIAPDLNDGDIQDIANVAKNAGLAGIIATNTTLDRDGLSDNQASEKGGLSGAPLFEKSTRVLAKLSAATNGEIPLIGVGGISKPEDVLAKIEAGACAVQVYSAMVYQGLSLIPDLAHGLDHLLEAKGYTNVMDAVGKGREAWL
ncbi:MAG: quinone-dependent dihydroorotate dehydrogenase [Planktomarina sp.]